MENKSKTFMEKLNAFRRSVNAMDWSPDGVNPNQNYKFLSNQKMKGNVGKALADNGLEWSVSYTDLQIMPAIGDRMGQHYIIKATATIMDTTSDEGVEWVAYGEAADTGDKAISKAQTNAFKNLIANNLMVSEYDAETESEIETKDTMRSEGMSEYKANKEMAKAKLIASNEDIPPVIPKSDGKPMTATQHQVLDKIISKVGTLDELMLAPFGIKDEIIEEGHTVQTAEQAASYIAKYKGVMACQ